MLLNEFLKEHPKVGEQDREIQEQEASIAQLKSALTKQEEAIAEQRKDFEKAVAELKRGMTAVVNRFKEQDAKILKVSDQIELNESGTRVAVNKP